MLVVAEKVLEKESQVVEEQGLVEREVTAESANKSTTRQRMGSTCF